MHQKKMKGMTKNLILQLVAESIDVYILYIYFDEIMLSFPDQIKLAFPTLLPLSIKSPFSPSRFAFVRMP